MAPILDYITGLVSPKKIAKDSNQTSTTILQSEVELQNQPHHFSNEDITHPDPKEKSVSASSYEINGSIAEIAGFTQEKLLEMIKNCPKHGTYLERSFTNKATI